MPPDKPKTGDRESDDQADKEAIAHDPAKSPLRSQSTSTVPAVLQSKAVSLFASTYQAGFVVALRANSETSLNTHFRNFPRPMGMAKDPASGRLAIGIKREIITFQNTSALSDRLEPSGKHDACYLPRGSHITGEIDIHEMAWGFESVQPSHPSAAAEGKSKLVKPELWFVNTRFSCLCTPSEQHSFVPRWWPNFITSLSDHDRCHLNGLAMADGKPKYATALAATDSRSGWREHKVRGGVLIDVESGEIITRRLSMPHSPRWHFNELWMLESGDGSIGRVDLNSGRYEAVIKLDGFTRGLAFAGPFAFVGLSQVRESASFSGIPLADRLEKRICGIAVVDLRSGTQIGFVTFEDAIQEIFAVEVMPHRFPEILEPSHEFVGSTYALPDESLKNVGKPADNPNKDESYCRDGQ